MNDNYITTKFEKKKKNEGNKKNIYFYKTQKTIYIYK